MDDRGGGFFKFLMTLCFAFGAWVFFKVMPYTDITAAKLGFGAIGVFSVLAAIGMLLTDMSATRFFRISTKLSAVMFPLSVNTGALLSGIFLLREMAIYAAVSAAVCAAVTVISAAVLAKRYREDDL